jgi:hypothetical protein
MSKKVWRFLRSRLAIEPSIDQLRPVTRANLETFEQKQSLRLPNSYRSFCEVFGPGRVGDWFDIAAPGYRGKAATFSLEKLNRMAHDGLEYEVYSKDPSQHARSLFFSLDQMGLYHFFDPVEVTDTRRHEYAVYTLFRDYKVKRTADNFGEFITLCCLGRKRTELIKGVPLEYCFRPVLI